MYVVFITYMPFHFFGMSFVFKNPNVHNIPSLTVLPSHKRVFPYIFTAVSAHINYHTYYKKLSTSR